MSNVLTSKGLIKSITRRAMLPKDQNTFEDQDFLDMLNEEIQYFGIPQLLRTHEEYLVRHEDESLVSGQTRYAIPERAVGNKLRDVAYIVDDGSSSLHLELSRVSLEDLSDYDNYFTSNQIEAFYIENNDIVLVNQVSASQGYLRKYFYLKPNTLVLDENAGVITDINTTTGVITLSNFPAAFSSLPKMDFVQKVSPNKIHDYSITPLAVDSVTKTITFTTTDIPSELAIGDYINIEKESIVPQLPTELHAILAQRVAIAALEALGDQEGATVAQRKLELMERSSNDLIDNRVEGAPEKIKTRHGALRQSVTSYRGRY